MRHKYTSGRPRVHYNAPAQSLQAAITEYEAFSGDPELAISLRETAADLREELEIRKSETWR